jgi:hypothetical protein
MGDVIFGPQPSDQRQHFVDERAALRNRDPERLILLPVRQARHKYEQQPTG